MNDQDKIAELIDIEANLQALLARTSRLRVQLEVNKEIKPKKSKLSTHAQSKLLTKLHKKIRSANTVTV